MAHIGNAKGPYTLSSLTDTLTFGPGANDNLDLSDTENVVMRISSTTGTFQLRGVISLDGNLWVAQAISTLARHTVTACFGIVIGQYLQIF